VPILLGGVSCLLFAVLTTSFIWRLLFSKTNYNKLTYRALNAGGGRALCWRKKNDFEDDDEDLEILNQELVKRTFSPPSGIVNVRVCREEVIDSHLHHPCLKRH